MGEKTETAFSRWKKQLIILDIVISVIVLALLAIFRPDLVLIAFFFLLIPYLLLTERKLFFYHFVLAFIIAFGWMLSAKDFYGYNTTFSALMGINLFTLFSWATGLFMVYVAYSYFEDILKKKGFLRQLLLFLAIYWPLLIVAEVFGYYILGIHNVATTAYPGLPICNCMHAPRWMQISYFALGPVFFSICYLLKLENPHSSKTIKKA